MRVELRGHGARVRIWRRATQWPMYGANPARTQVHSAIRLRPPFRPIWHRPLHGLVEFPAVVWEGVAYVNNINGWLHAVSMRSGRVLWKRRVGSLVASSPAVDPDRGLLLVTTMEPGYVKALDLQTGKSRWRYYTGRAEPSPVIRNGIAYLGATNGNIYALDLDRHRPRWVFHGGVKVTSSPALVGKRLYYGDYAGPSLCARRPERAPGLARKRRDSCLRNRRGRSRACLRAVGLLGHVGSLGAYRKASVEDPDRGVHVLVARGLSRASVFRDLRRACLLRRRPVRKDLLDAAGRWGRVRSGPGRERRRLRREHGLAHHGVAVALGSPALVLPTRSLRRGLRQRVGVAHAWQRSDLGCRSEAQAMTWRRVLVGLAVLALLAVAGAAAAWWLNNRETRDIRGSATVEFDTTQAGTTRPEEEVQTEPWPLYGLTPQRTRDAVDFEHSPPFRTAWLYDAKSLLEFPPVIAYGKLYFSNIEGDLVALDAETGKVVWRQELGYKAAASPAVGDGVVYMPLMSKRRHGARADDRGGRRSRRRDRARTLASFHGRCRVVAALARRRALLRQLRQARSTPWTPRRRRSCGHSVPAMP